MALTIIDLIIYSCIAAILILIIALFYFNYSKIMSFFFPHKYNMVTVLESDNNVTTWIQKKNDSARFEFNNGFYNMYDTFEENVLITNQDGTQERLNVPTKKESSIYRNGRLAQFFYVEGNEEPLDFRNNKISSNPQMRKQMLSMDLTKLFTMGQGIKTWILYAVVGFLIGVIIGNIVGGYNKIPKPEPIQNQIIIGWWVVECVRKLKSGWKSQHSRNT